jgi:hypothetical protein
MCCAEDIVLSKNLTLYCATPICTSLQLTIPILKTISIYRDFGVWPKHGNFNFF